jgi:hypothetical protein
MYEEYIRMTAHQCQYLFRPPMEPVMLSKRQEAVPPGKVFNLKAWNNAKESDSGSLNMT